jgi:DNA primase catalytic core
MITNEIEIKNAIQIFDIISDFVALKRKGSNYKGCCPFHNERTPSFVVFTNSNTFKCFGCGEAGDAIVFLKKHEQHTYAEALTYIANHYSIAIIEGVASQKDQEEKTKKEAILAANKFAAEHFAHNLTQNLPAFQYISQRNLIDAISPYQLGYSEPGNTLMRAASSAGYNLDILYEAGLINKNEQGSYYDSFSRRIMFPFMDRSGRIIGFTGRILTTEKDKPKYINTKETEVFSKSKFLYGLYQSRRTIVEEKECFLVEGQTDTISLFLAGIKNSVAGSGTALSETQVKMINSFTTCLTFVYDDDDAGIRASIANIKIPLQHGMDVYVVVLPKNEDPDSFVKKAGAEAVRAYFELHRKNLVSFRIDLIKEEVKKDILQKAKLVKELTTQISLIPDEQTRGILIREICSKLQVNIDDLSTQVKKSLPKPIVDTEKGFFAFDASKDGIREKNEVIILPDPTEVVDRHASGIDNVIGLPHGAFDKEDIFKLSSITKNVIIEGLLKIVDDSDSELPLAITGRMLTEFGIHVIVRSEPDIDDKTGEITYRLIDFLDFYVDSLSKYLNNHPDTKRSKKYVELVAEFLSKLDNTIIHIKTTDIAKKFALSQTSFSKVLKPFIEKRKNLASQHQEKIVIDDANYVFDLNHIPDYVDLEAFQRNGFFPAQNKTGHKIFYVFRTLDNTLVKVANFYIEPLFQVYDQDPNRNKRIVKLFHSELHKEEYVEFKSWDMIELTPFKKFLWNYGPYIFSNGKQFHHEKIINSMSMFFPKCHELTIFGWQSEGFFAFCNGIIADGNFTPVDELGLVKFKNETYYLPAFSKIYEDERTENDKYQWDRFLIWKPNQNTSWVEWGSLMHKVFSYNDNGTWALLFTILAAHRSAIFQIDRLFTALFFIGPTESGKSKIAESIRAPFMHGAPIYNLNSGTDASMFTNFERLTDIPFITEEYNDSQISDIKFQGLKAAVYDNEGKQKRKDATSKEIDISKVNCSPILLGQEAPEKDDGSLQNRVVLLPVPKKDNWTDEEVNLFKDLKDREADGLSNIAVEIIKRRPLIIQHFAKYTREYQKLLKQDIIKEGGTYQTRIINTVTLFVAMCKTWTVHVPELPLPFTFDEFYEIAKKQINRQSEDLASSNRLSVFFDTIAMLYTQGQIVAGREFEIVSEKRITIQKTRTETEELIFEEGRKKVLYLIINDVIQIYQKLHGADSLKINALRTYLRDNPAYLGQIKSHRFIYEIESWEPDPLNRSANLIRVKQKAERNTSCIAMDYDKLSQLGIDLDRMKYSEQTFTHDPTKTTENNIPNEPEKSKNTDDELPF